MFKSESLLNWKKFGKIISIETKIAICLKVIAHLMLHIYFGYFVILHTMRIERFDFLRDHLKTTYGKTVRYTFIFFKH